MTITVELLRDDALDLIRQLEKRSILRVKNDKKVVQPKKNDITKLYGTLILLWFNLHNPTPKNPPCRFSFSRLYSDNHLRFAL